MNNQGDKWDCMRIRTFLSPKRVNTNPNWANTFTIEDFNTSLDNILIPDTESPTFDNKDKNWLGIPEYSSKACEIKFEGGGTTFVNCSLINVNF